MADVSGYVPYFINNWFAPSLMLHVRINIFLLLIFDSTTETVTYILGYLVYLSNSFSGLCGRLEILSLSFAVGSSVQFKFTANSPQSKIHWQFEDKGTFITLGLEARVRLTNNRARTVFGRKLNILSGDMGTYRVQCSDGGVSNIVVLAVGMLHHRSSYWSIYTKNFQNPYY